MGGRDKRRHPRFDGGGLQALLKVDGTTQGTVVENVSLGGALLTGSCGVGKNVLLELRLARGRSLKLVGRVVAMVPKGRGRAQSGVRVRFNPASPSCTSELHALIAATPTDPEVYEFHSLTLDDAEPETELAFDIDIGDPEESGEVVIELSEVVDDEPTVIVAALEHELETRQMRIQELERQLALVRRSARTLEELLVPAALAS